MKIYFKDQNHAFLKHLSMFKTKAVIQYNTADLIEKTSIISVEGYSELEEIDFDFLFNYQIFPSNILTFCTEWTAEGRKMKPGDTIVQQALIPPFKGFSQKIIFAVRIKEIIEEANRKGFSYETLEGHVEKGISTFTIEQSDNKIQFKIKTFSKPGNILTKLFSSVFSIPYQTYCTNAALKNVKRQIENQSVEDFANTIWSS